MELRQIEYFLAVAEEGSFTAAAARLYMVQSSLSASLLALERELGADLFVRGRRGTELTDAGTALMGPARAALEQVARARDAVDEVVGLHRGTVRVGAMPLPRRIDVAETIQRFTRDHPDVHVQLVPGDSRSLLTLVAEGEVDFAVAGRPDRMPAIRFEPLFRTELTLVCPADHRLAGAHHVEPEDLRAEQIIDLPRGWHARETFDRLFREKGLQRRVGFEVDDWLALVALVKRGMGVSYGPLACVDKELFGQVANATLVGSPRWEIGIATRDDTLRGLAGRALLDAYREDVRRARSDISPAVSRG
jgi:DNA-binding transcriptional LysR family regulator